MYRSKLFNIVLNHRFTNLDCADQYVVQMCPELTKFLPISNGRGKASLMIFLKSCKIFKLLTDNYAQT